MHNFRLYSLCFLGLFLILSVFHPAPQNARAELLVYTALEDDELPVYLEKFKQSHPDIQVKIIRDSTGVITAKLLAEKVDINDYYLAETYRLAQAGRKG